MKIQSILHALEEVAPPVYQEGYDNAGLITGNAQAEVSGAVLCLDATEAVIDEAIALHCNLVIAHHPIVFKAIKRFTGKNYVERVIIKAIKHDIAIYAAHTNLDNVFHKGVNAKIAERLGLSETRILAPKQVWKKLRTQIPADHRVQVGEALSGISDIRIFWSAPSEETLGLEVTAPQAREYAVQQAIQSVLPQPVFLEIFALESPTADIGSGMIGRLPHPVQEEHFLRLVKEKMNTAVIRHTPFLGNPIQKVALCGGAGGFLLPQAIAQGADIFITGDYKYHEFFDADGRILIADIGHFESEQFTIELFYEILSEKFHNFALHYTKVNTNPVRYLI
ncbi:MAG: Nif3-like dinuclear metal center hexameric protein [Saprospirales bacterium]|nr:Nif3-like dinuclear metal center hexameric protein [Saprospirales bacterium]MBK8490630.1 Nif3-like dinuclear metal center hexameric protein [Saprospirales bacterium]